MNGETRGNKAGQLCVEYTLFFGVAFSSLTHVGLRPSQCSLAVGIGDVSEVPTPRAMMWT